MSGPELNKTTDFGFTQVPVADKAAKVAEVFTSVAAKYDVMNDLMSLGIHRLWKRYAMSLTGVRPGQRVLDVAGGTGDLAKQLATQVGKTGQVLLCDINAAMLQHGRDKLLNQGYAGNIYYLQGNAECLPFAEQSFDCITIAFGLRNVTDKQAALASMYRVLKPGGRLLVLEFSQPVIPLLKACYDSYSFNILPRLGGLVAGDAASYRYLVESIRRHPAQQALKDMILSAGFDHCEYHNLTGGIVALHRGYKF